MARKFPLSKQLHALSVYRSLHGDLAVPRDFVVPDAPSEWPLELTGMDLGERANQLRRAQSKFEGYIEQGLSDMGFLWSTSRHFVRCSKLDGLSTWIVDTRSWEDIIDGLSTVPATFVVPVGDKAWPLTTWGLLLAETIRLMEVHAYQLTDAEWTAARSLGLLATTPPWDDLMQLLALFKISHGSADVPIDYVVPHTAPWPDRWHGARLGELSWKVWMYAALLDDDRQDDLSELRFAFNTVATWASTIEAARHYASLYRSTAISLAFVVPANDPEWPKERWDQPLGRAMSYFNVALKWHSPPEGSTSVWQEVQMQELTPFDDARQLRLLILGISKHHQYHGTTNVPSTFVVPSQDFRWGDTLPGLALGAAIDALRRRRAHLNIADVAALDDVGMVWDPDAHAVFLDVAAVIKTWHVQYPFVHLNDCTFLRAHSIWPKRFWDKPFGSAMLLLEAHKAYAAPLYVAETLALGFNAAGRWHSKLAALATFRTLFQHLHVPRTFVVPRPTPTSQDSSAYWPPETHGLPLGIVVEWLRELGEQMAPARRADLDSVGFEWEPVDLDVIAKAKTAFDAQNPGWPAVPNAFVIPKRAPWPAAGVALGRLMAPYAVFMDAMAQRHGSSVAALRKKPAPASWGEGPSPAWRH
ncbi:hypothetical protein ACHHYP_14960 [Achlya hypogyna]|uniref:Helicase-associated domain-containing protein n=1 Tax=Achlya hypogyna TaxID=1202772 RepID=A0A1V9YBW3_ACHHY|nr:hypothetical protein ACHHYP_14960 [Achlya hypogyna]